MNTSDMSEALLDDLGKQNRINMLHFFKEELSQVLRGRDPSDILEPRDRTKLRKMGLLRHKKGNNRFCKADKRFFCHIAILLIVCQLITSQ